MAQALVSVNSLLLRPWIEALRPVRGKLTAPLAAIFQDKSRSDSEHTLATDILTDYASDDPDRLAELLMVADPKAYLSLFPVAEKRAEQVLAVFRAELAKKATYSWNDPPLDLLVDQTRRLPCEPDRVGTRHFLGAVRLLPDDANGRVPHDRGGSPQVRLPTRAVPSLLRWAGSCEVAAVWTRDGRNWRIAYGRTADEVRQQDERNKKDKFIPVDVAGYATTDATASPPTAMQPSGSRGQAMKTPGCTLGPPPMSRP